MNNGDVKTIKAEWVSVILLILIQMSVSIWWAASTDQRVTNLEQQASKGERFTATDGELLYNDIQHLNDMVIQHIERTEPKIDDIHEAIINKYGHE